MEITAVATSQALKEQKGTKVYGTVFYEDENQKVIMYKTCLSQQEYQEELAHAVDWAESETSAVGVRGVPVGGAK